MAARFTFDCNAASKPLAHFWEHTVGSDHAPMGLRADWREQLARAHAELGVRHVRFHGLLSDDMGTLVCENGRLLAVGTTAELQEKFAGAESVDAHGATVRSRWMHTARR